LFETWCYLYLHEPWFWFQVAQGREKSALARLAALEAELEAANAAAAGSAALKSELEAVKVRLGSASFWTGVCATGSQAYFSVIYFPLLPCISVPSSLQAEAAALCARLESSEALAARRAAELKSASNLNTENESLRERIAKADTERDTVRAQLAELQGVATELQDRMGTVVGVYETAVSELREQYSDALEKLAVTVTSSNLQSPARGMHHRHAPCEGLLSRVMRENVALLAELSTCETSLRILKLELGSSPKAVFPVRTSLAALA
jgi:hypothetical protein